MDPGKTYKEVKVYDPITKRSGLRGFGDNDVSLMPEFYKDNQLTSKIVVRISKPSGWSLQNGISFVYDVLRNQGQIVDIDSIFLWVAYELIRTIEFKPEKDFTCGGFPVWPAGHVVTIDHFIEAQYQEFIGPTSTGEDINASNMRYGILFVVLLVSRTTKTIANADDYLDRLLKGCQSILLTAPYNLKLPFLQGVDQQKSTLLSYRLSPLLRQLTAALDYLLKAMPQTEMASMRMATLASHNSDHAMVNLINQMTRTLISHPVSYIYLIVLPEAVHEFSTVSQNYREIYELNSIQPYTRSLGLIQKSPYSATQNPHLYATIGLFLALTSSPSYFNVNKPSFLVDPDLVCGYIIHNYYRSSGDARKYIQPKETTGYDPDEDEPEFAMPTTENGAADWVIKELKKCNYQFNAEMLAYIQPRIPKNPRESSIGEYLMNLIPTETNRPGLMNVDIPFSQKNVPQVLSSIETTVFDTLPGE